MTFEDKYFHWITHRVVNVLKEEGTIQMEARKLAHGAPVNMVWHRKNRYVKRQSTDLIRLIDAYSHPDFTAALGNTGELLVSDGFRPVRVPAARAAREEVQREGMDGNGARFGLRVLA